MLSISGTFPEEEPKRTFPVDQHNSLGLSLPSVADGAIKLGQSDDAIVCRRQAEKYLWVNESVEYGLFLLAQAPISFIGRTKSYVFDKPAQYQIHTAQSGNEFGQIEFLLPDSQRQGANYRIRWHTVLEGRFSHTAPSFVVEWGFGRDLKHRKTLIEWTDNVKDAIKAIGFTEDRVSPASFPNSFPWAEQSSTGQQMRWMNYKIREHARDIQDSSDFAHRDLKIHASIVLDAIHFKYDPTKEHVDGVIDSLRNRGGYSAVAPNETSQAPTDWERIRPYVVALAPSVKKRIEDLFEVRDRFGTQENGDRLLLIFLDSYNLLTKNIIGLGIADSVRTVQALRPLVLDQVAHQHSTGLAQDTEALNAFLRAIRDLNPIAFSDFAMQVVPFCRNETIIESVLSLTLASDGVTFAKYLREYVGAIAVGYQPSPLWKSAFDKVVRWATISGEDYDVIKRLDDERTVMGTDYEGKVKKFLEVHRTRPKDITDTWRSRYSQERMSNRTKKQK